MAPIPPTVPKVPRKSESRDRRLRIAAVVLAVSWMVNESCVSSAADRVAGVVPTTELSELGRLWARYDSLSRRSSFSSTTNDLADALTDQTLTLADRVMANYRSPQPSVREAQWRQLRTALARAIATRPNDTRLRAMLHYTDGHLHRIDGEARKARRQVAESQREFADAIAAFRDAAELQPDWPDPYLGLARTYVYGLDDVDRAVEALRRAERSGFVPGHREAAQLGDGYRTRADSLWRSGRDVTGLTQELEYVTRAVELYRLALDQYARAADYEGVARNIGMAQRGLNVAERRLATLVPQPDAEQAKPWQ